MVSCQRPNYKAAQDMGTWLTIFQLISYIAVITNFLIIAFTSEQLNTLLDNPPTALKLAVVVIAEHIVFAMKGLVVYSIPAEPYNVRVARARAVEIARAETEYRDYLEWVGKQNTLERKYSTFQEDQAYKQHLRDHAHQLLYANVEMDEFEVEDVDPLASPEEILSDRDLAKRREYELEEAKRIEEMEMMQRAQAKHARQQLEDDEPPLPGLDNIAADKDDEEYVYRPEIDQKESKE